MIILYSLFIILCVAFTVSAKLEPINFLSLPVKRTCQTCKEGMSLKTADPFMGVKMQHGFIHTGREGGQMFYWIVPTDQVTGELSTNKEKPWAVWLTGGPGCGSELALFTENGPINVLSDGKMEKNPYSWHQLADMIYIDQPLGSGFSDAAGNPCNYATTEETIALDMKYFLEQLIHTYSAFKDRPFYITGESYAGHYIPSVGHYLAEYPVVGLKFIGVAIGNGWVDPIYQYPAYAKFALENKLIGRIAYEISSKALELCVGLIKAGKFAEAVLTCNSVVNGILGKRNPYDIRLDCEVPPLCYNSTALTTYLNRVDVQEILGTTKKWEECDTKVYMFLLRDFNKQTRTKVESLLRKGFKVLIYSGDKDYICNWRGGEAWISKVSWDRAEEFITQSYKTWSVAGKASGEYKHVDNLAFLRVYDAGHMVPMDQPVVALQMLKDFLYSSTLEKNTTKSRESRDFLIAA